MKVVSSLLVVVVICLWSYAQERPTAESVFRSYESSLKSIRGITFDSRCMDREAGQRELFTNGLSQKWKIDFEGKRLWRTTQALNDNIQTESSDRRARVYHEKLLTPDAMHQLTARIDTNVAESFTSYLEVPDDYWATGIGWSYLAFPFGYLNDGREYRYIPDMIRNAPKEVTAAEGDGSPGVVLACRLDECEFRVVLNPSKGWMAERIEFARTPSPGDPGRAERLVYSVARSSSHDGVWLPELYQCEISKPSGKRNLPARVRVVDGALVVVPEGSEMGANSIEIPERTVVAEVALSSIDVGPLSASDFQIQTVVPDGLEVHMQDAQHLFFAWREGGIVPSTDEALRVLGRSRFVAGPGSPRSWAVIAAFLLVPVASYFAIRNWRTRRKSSP